MADQEKIDLAHHALQAWSGLENSKLMHIGVGNINLTFRVDVKDCCFILQRLHPKWLPEVHEDIEAVTRHLSKKGMVTPHLVRTDAGGLFALRQGCWRLQTFIAGANHTSLASSAHAYEAGLLVGRFHQALSDFDHRYRFSRPSVHDTRSHVVRLQAALAQNAKHPYFAQIQPIANGMSEDVKDLFDFGSLPLRHCHGDLKISNFVFNMDGHALCLFDWDTLGLLPFAIEMGDAFRSWCNPAGEETTDVYFDASLFSAAIEGYASAASRFWTEAEVQALIWGMKTIPLELSARFLVDVFEDQYWNWDEKRFATRAEHNLLRGQGQWMLYKNIKGQLRQLERVIRLSF